MSVRTFVRLGLSCALLVACGDDTSATGAGGSGAAGGGTGGNVFTGGGPSTGGADGGNPPQGGFPPLEEAPCGTHPQPYQCGDLLDNDQDGLVDSYDPDCLGPCDDTEGSYHGGIPGQNNDPCKMDCYWDTNSGSSEGCYWDHRCDPNEVAPGYYPEPWNGATCEYDPDFTLQNGATCDQAQAGQAQECLDYCAPLTPNGCDCFGCCELPAGSGAFVYLGSEGVNKDTECTADQLDNPEVCHPCIPVASCANDCAPCEVCIGKPEPDPGCSEGQCPAGVQACGQPGQDACPSGYYCTTGCCRPLAPPE